MSHFSVLVVADDEQHLEKVMLPYHEYECTGIAQYLQFVPTNMEEAKEYYQEELRVNVNSPTLAEFIKDYYGHEPNEEGVFGRWTNPNKKWDWWVVGGRWSGLLLRTDGSRGNYGKPREIDWNGMRQEKIDKVRNSYQCWQALSPEDRKNPGRVLDTGLSLFISPEERTDLETLTEEQYVEKYAAPKALTFAYVDAAGAWHERAEMGWFAITSNPNDNYDQEWWKFVSEVPVDKTLYLVDCHI